MKGVNLLIGVLCFYLNISNGNFQDSSSIAVANEMCKRYTEDAKNNHICPLPRETSLIGGMLAENGEFPHMVQIAYSKSNTTKYLCSGFIISKNYILTAAHCVNDEGRNKPQFVRAGVTDVNDVSNEQVRSIDSIIIHPEFKRPAIYNDIALIKVTEDFNFNKFVNPICLYTSDEDPDGYGVHPGWGPTGDDFGNQEKQTHMIKLSLNFDSNESCNNTFFPLAKSVLPEGIVKNKIVCAGGKTGGCQVDSGSPLQIYRKNSNEQPCMYDAVGVSSFGSRICGKKQFPTAFTRISNYIKWIQVNVWP
ncbi:unnamed protein product [Diabrotica balteata]|uniref:Peptidase S1 domain-containing protein n=1 Tax=Diabrotica balteata TaxID=107213 RepID=A0A9N9SXW9_DIABA|nr:unnamed protein product [Diabrotica balteata]